MAELVCSTSAVEASSALVSAALVRAAFVSTAFFLSAFESSPGWVFLGMLVSVSRA